MSDGPINYTSQFAPTVAPDMAFARGLSIADRANQQIEAQQAAQAQAQAEAQRKQQVQALIAKINSPRGTAEDRANLTLLVSPEQAKIIQTHFQDMDKQKLSGSIRDSMGMFAAFDQGEPDVAIDLMKQQAEARRADGDEAGAKMLETWAEVAGHDPNAAKNWLGGLIPLSSEGKDAMQSYLDQQASPHNIAKTDSETFKNYMDALSQKYAMQGKLTAQQSVELENNLRKEYFNNTSDFQGMKTYYGKMLNAQESGAGDLDIIFGYMKMLDPTSVVREGEQDSAVKTAGIPDQVWSAYLKASSGQKLAPAQRKGFLDQAKALYKNAEQNEKIVRDGISTIATNHGLPLDNIFYQPEGVTEPQKVGGASDNGGSPMPNAGASFDATALTITKPDGTVHQYPDKATFDADMAKLRSRGVFK